MIFNNGFVYRWGVRIKDFGKRMGHKKIFGIPVLRWGACPVISLGLAIIASVMNRPVADFFGEK
jgi:hypothetical protein